MKFREMVANVASWNIGRFIPGGHWNWSGIFLEWGWGWDPGWGSGYTAPISEFLGTFIFGVLGGVGGAFGGPVGCVAGILIGAWVGNTAAAFLTAFFRWIGGSGSTRSKKPNTEETVTPPELEKEVKNDLNMGSKPSRTVVIAAHRKNFLQKQISPNPVSVAVSHSAAALKEPTQENCSSPNRLFSIQKTLTQGKPPGSKTPEISNSHSGVTGVTSAASIETQTQTQDLPNIKTR